MLALAVALAVTTLGLASCQQHAATTAGESTNVDSLRQVALQLVASNDTIASHLKTFDVLDFDVFSNQKWDRLRESHAKDIKVYWPDGHMAQGIDVHIDDLKKLFVFAPDTRIKQHPIAFGSGNYTVVTGVMEGTFTKPMPVDNGKFITPTGKAFRLPMATVGLWTNGVMTEEHLFWDNQSYNKQLGI
ncbi:ester cyclase [Fibrella sp. HMF5335]|uniref:Ester cyclase n=2 Tax=Fibrella rubiginis TaxID=2817060 RepID=A0A939K083_9BACT|nr:ester cyclase [Fibrella rubiginis]